MSREMTREDEIKLGPPDHEAWRRIFSEREAEVVEMVAQGYTDPEIANELNLAASTIKQHLVHIRDKLKVTRRIHVARWWWEHVEQPRKMADGELIKLVA